MIKRKIILIKAVNESTSQKYELKILIVTHLIMSVYQPEQIVITI